MNVLVIRSSTVKARAAIAILRAEVDAMAMSLPERAAQMAVTKARGTSLFNDRSGQTRGSIRAEQISQYRTRFHAAGASLFVNAGTGLHGPKASRYPIVAKNVPLLKFQVAGRWVSKREVSHTGQKATHFIDRAIEEAESFMLSDLSFQLSGIIAAHNR